MRYESQVIIIVAILMLGMTALSSQSSVNDVLATLEISESTSTINSINYTTYTSDVYGITFEYPSDWDLEEKTNRFASEPEVKVNDGLNSFKFLGNDDRLSLDNSFFDLELVATMAQNSFVEGSGDRLIEGVSTDKYQIDGYDTASFLYTSETLFGMETANEVFMVDNNNDVYTLGFTDLVDDFDTPQNKEIRDHILNSFHFIGSNSNDDEVEDEEDNN